jgi:hypothetical protein
MTAKGRQAPNAKRQSKLPLCAHNQPLKSGFKISQIERLVLGQDPTLICCDFGADIRQKTATSRRFDPEA